MTAASPDTILIGAGHNGLALAALLGKTQRVLVLEQRDVVGGLAAAQEFHPGYTHTGVLHDTTCVRDEIVSALNLQGHGLKRLPHGPDVLALGNGNGSAVMIPGDDARAAAELGDDAPRYSEYRAFLRRMAPVLRMYLDQPPVDFVHVESEGLWGLLQRGLKVRRLGKRDMLELLRIPPMCVADWLNEWFGSESVKAALSLPAVARSFAGPWSPGTNINLLFSEATAAGMIEGGALALIAALQKAAEAANVEMRTSSTVEEVLVGSDGVEGVRLAGGEEIRAKRVVATCDPQQAMLKLLPAGAVPFRTVTRMSNYRSRGTLAHVVLALKGSLEFAARPGEAVEFARTGGSLDEVEQAFDALKYRDMSRAPVLDIHVPTVRHPQLAPEGGSVVSVLAHFAPYELKFGWDDAQRTRLGDAVLNQLEVHAPGVSGKVVARQVLAPPDLESTYGVTGGQIFHGEEGIDQILARPVPECVDYSTPVSGYYLCSGGTHPGGGLTCAPAVLAAKKILAG